MNVKTKPSPRMIIWMALISALMHLAELSDQVAGGGSSDEIRKTNDAAASKVARVLLRKGANIELKNRFGHTALYIARRNHLPHLIQLLEHAKSGRHAPK